MKLTYLRARYGERVITGATATPIANSVTEAHVMLRYLRPDLLAAAGVEEFDVWAATFGQTITEVEMAPEGGGSYRQKTRFARFQNVPEMLRMWNVPADVKTADDLNLPKPALARRSDGQHRPETVVIDPSPEAIDYVNSLADRAEEVRSGGVTATEDNMLKISTDGRKAALDMRLVGGAAASTPTKLDVAADRIAAIWDEYRDRVYLNPATDQPSAPPGALQIVFCDLGTPSERWNAYDELRDQLVRRGLPRAKVRFIHEAKNDLEKARLFAAARAGEIAVLIGSTEKMGVGTNIQTRAIALHHLDAPWRPADVEQREGRVLRQGNQNPEVRIYRYVVERTFDAYMWQTLERKARFIAQMTRGHLDVREIEDIGDATLSAAEVKALAAGDPLMLEKAKSDTELARLERLRRAYARNQQSLLRRIASAESILAKEGGRLELLIAADARRRDMTGGAFSMRVGATIANTRTRAIELICDWAAKNMRSVQANEIKRALGELGELGGLAIDAEVRPGLGTNQLVLSLRDVPVASVVVTAEDITSPNIGLVRTLVNRVSRVPEEIIAVRRTIATANDELAESREALGQPFKHGDALAAARTRSAEIAARMRLAADPRGVDATELAQRCMRLLGAKRWERLVASAETMGIQPLSIEGQRAAALHAIRQLDGARAWELQRVERDRRVCESRTATASARDDLKLRSLSEREHELLEAIGAWSEQHEAQIARWLRAEMQSGELPPPRQLSGSATHETVMAREAVVAGTELAV